jgi:hypothetical protein
MGLLLSNYKHVETKIEWNHGANSNQLYRPEGSLTRGEASPADRVYRYFGQKLYISFDRGWVL